MCLCKYLNVTQNINVNCGCDIHVQPRRELESESRIDQSFRFVRARGSQHYSSSLHSATYIWVRSWRPSLSQSFISSSCLVASLYSVSSIANATLASSPQLCLLIIVFIFISLQQSSLTTTSNRIQNETLMSHSFRQALQPRRPSLKQLLFDEQSQTSAERSVFAKTNPPSKTSYRKDQ